MTVTEVAKLNEWSREYVRSAITEGVQLPKSKEIKRLKAEQIGSDYDIEESDLDEFLLAFEREEPGRHPPTGVKRKLRTECGEKCGFCREIAPLTYHHIDPWSQLKHYDPERMIAICFNCHARVERGEFNRQQQFAYKDKLRKGQRDEASSRDPIRFTWEEVAELIQVLRDTLTQDATPEGAGQYDFSLAEMAEKNKINRLGEDYFQHMRERHEPYFARIERFLRDPTNTELADAYAEIVEVLASQIAARREEFGGFEEALQAAFLNAREDLPETVRQQGRLLNVLMSYMYFECDIGHKNDTTAQTT